MPEFKIRTLLGYNPEEGKTYLLDSNVWLLVLQPPIELKAYEQVYIDFFDSLVRLAINPECKNKPAIHMNGLIFSEVFNAYMRSNWRAFKPAGNSVVTYKEYRQTADFENHSKAIKSDMNFFKSIFRFNAIDPSFCIETLVALPDDSDYNDFYYFRLAERNNFTIVTNDGDYLFSEVEILTNNGQLLKRSKK